jgi:tetratricopeptide (TPR) repeat protein
MTTGQVTQNATASKSTDGEKKTDPMKNGPAWLMNRSDWERMHQSNASYLENVIRVQQAMDRFKNDAYWSDVLQQTLGQTYPYLGRYQKALECFDRQYHSRRKEPAQLVDADRFEPCDAVAAILELADKHRVVMINEAHHVPLHRAFTLQLLEGLYRKGFRYFAAETLLVGDEALQTRGYPTLKTGGYTAEPVYSDLVRTALSLGYKVTPYECEDSPSPEPGNPVPAMNIREQGQAKNLKERILDLDPDAKIIVHAGFGHISKKPLISKLGEKRMMALVFQELTGIEPLSIDQTEMSEVSKPENESPDYRFAVEKGLVKDRPVVLRDKEKESYFVRSAEFYDLTVIHPRSRYENGRPTWLAMGGRRAAHHVQTEVRPAEGASYLAQAFYAKEMGPDAVPIDQMEYSYDEPVPTLWLPPGEMHIRIVDEKADVIHEYVHATCN